MTTVLITNITIFSGAVVTMTTVLITNIIIFSGAVVTMTTVLITNIIIFSGAVVTMTTVLIISALGSANMVSATSGKVASFAHHQQNYVGSFF